ncbi:SRPBCC family protein [Plantactinospora siamensis]|uniref:SRPBCC family protein n=1 Tax=Plantactinospora siamensis TaxID=555372 RepID=A0ABV6P227_9ACTN
MGGNDREQSADVLPRVLGLTSLGLGLATFAAPRPVARWCGIDDSARAQELLAVVGMREFFHAAGLLRATRTAPWTWTRVFGDAMDLGLLAAAVGSRRGERRRRAARTTAVIGGIALADLAVAVRQTRRESAASRMVRVVAATTVNRPPEEAYRFWRDLENLPRFMDHLDRVSTDGDGRSTWTAHAPAGRAVTWQAEIVEDDGGRLIAWRSVDGSRVPNSGRVRFEPAPGGRGTEVRVELAYRPPGGRLGRAVARMLGEDPAQQVNDDLRRFKQVLETGEITRSEASPGGLSTHQQLRQRPAAPAAGGRR